jgi:hypothetical protein
MVKLIEERLIQQETNLPASNLIVGAYFYDRFGGFGDYMGAVESVWGGQARYVLAQAVEEARAEAEFDINSLSVNRQVQAQMAMAEALLRLMPEPDFRQAIEVTLLRLKCLHLAAARITAICRNRGIHWRLDAEHGWQWIGDEAIEREVMQPALSILNDPRFASGVRVEFEQARTELKVGAPQARKQVLTEAASSVEGAMKVVLDQRGVPYARGDGAQKLFEHLRDAGLVSADMERILLGVALPRNRRGAHGAGAVAHEVRETEAEAFIALAATAIVFLGKLLP